jgi:hypothetical protein
LPTLQREFRAKIKTRSDVVSILTPIVRERIAPALMHVYEVRPRKDHRGIDLISDALPFSGLWYIEVPHAIG